MTKPVSLTQFQPPRVGSARSSMTPAIRPNTSDTRRVLIDSYGRTIRDLRLSITDRCNFRCVYCMDPDVRFAQADELLTVDELVRVARICIGMGINGIRLTGGEPTLHPQIPQLIERISALASATPECRTPNAVPLDLSMTTNGSLADEARLADWRRRGLKRLTFSLDSVRPDTFAAMTRSTTGVDTVINAIRAAKAAGLGPIKVNAVVLRGRNEDQIPLLAALAMDIGFEMRFIEYMPLDSGHHWSPSMLVPASEIIARIGEKSEIIPLGKAEPSSTSETWAFASDPKGTHARIGVIAPVTRPFCGACSRLRITADGQIRPCLFSLEEFDLRSQLRNGAGDSAIEDFLLDSVWTKQKGHGITAPGFAQPERSMSAIGG